jgi:hypothetical protein
LIKAHIQDGDGTGLVAHVHGFSTSKRDDHSGLLVLTRQFQNFSPEFHPFLNDTFGTAMNQNIAFGGTQEIIHNGGTSVEWTGTALSGTWNFADGGKMTITSANNNDAASFAEEGATTIDMSGFTALTGKVDLDIYNSTNNSIIVAFDLAGVSVGNSVDLNDYIDTGGFAEQNFVVPKADLGLTTQLLDGMTITMTRLGGTKPTVKFDDIQFEQTGTPAVFKATTPLGTRYHINKLRFVMADALDAFVTVAGATENATLPALSYNKLLGVSALSNGITFQRVQNGKVNLSVILKQLSDFLATGSTITDAISDGTNTFISMEVGFLEPIVLEGGAGNFLSLTINDNLSGLLQFTAAARGALEV